MREEGAAITSIAVSLNQTAARNTRWPEIAWTEVRGRLESRVKREARHGKRR